MINSHGQLKPNENEKRKHNDTFSIKYHVPHTSALVAAITGQKRRTDRQRAIRCEHATGEAEFANWPISARHNVGRHTAAGNFLSLPPFVRVAILVILDFTIQQRNQTEMHINTYIKTQRTGEKKKRKNGKFYLSMPSTICSGRTSSLR
jgi:hypothetical protein